MQQSDGLDGDDQGDKIGPTRASRYESTQELLAEASAISLDTDVPFVTHSNKLAIEKKSWTKLRPECLQEASFPTSSLSTQNPQQGQWSAAK